MVNKDSEYYVAIDEPKLFRRELLGSTKVIIKLLQKYEELKKTRENKIKLTFQYSNVISEINMLVNKLRKLIPRNKISNIPKIENLPEESKLVSSSNSRFQTKGIRYTPKVISSNNIDDLHNQLSDIEARLNGLGQ
jgi:hypothetical protein